MALKVKTSVESGIVVLDLTGRLWILDLPLQGKINALLAEGHRFYVLNLLGVDYIDSSGLGQLISIWASSRSRGGHLVIVRPNSRIRKLFAITKLDTVFDIFEDLSEALAFMQQRIGTRS